MPRGIPGSGPNAGRGKGRKTKSHTLADIAARSGGGQQASQTATGSAAPAAAPAPAAASTGRGRSGKGRAKGTKTTARRGTRGQRAVNGQQRADQAGAPKTGNGTTGMAPQADINGVKIEVMAVPGRGGRPQQSEAFPFAALDVSEKTGDSIVGPSFLIPDSENPDNVLAAARKRHKGKTFTARKMEGGVRIWRLT
jgi:hypothetical protein